MSFISSLRRLCYTALSLLCLTSLSAYSDSQTDAIAAAGWHLAKNDHIHHIQAYLRQDPGKRLKSFLIEADFQAPPDAVGGVLIDFDHFCDWIYRCGEARVIQRISDTEYQIYIIHDAPYGITDRDTIIHGLAYRDDQRHAVIVKTWEEQHLLPDQPHYVRMINEELEWIFTPGPDGTMHLELVGYADPGGWIPRWIDNLVQLDAPYYSVRGLLRMVKKSEYSDGKKLPEAVQNLWHGLIKP
ncbi:MAG: hypothetical protein HKM02_01505 [Pseudomonadales bacterium]|nr:hypothetical protein [Pseudomonadales bacterium]